LWAWLLDLHIPKDIRARGQADRIPPGWRSQSYGGVTGRRNFLQGKCIEKPIEGQEKSAGIEVPALRDVNGLRRSLEDDLRHELYVAGFARTNGRSAVEIANGVTHLAETASRGAHSGHRIGCATAAHRSDSR
jgi:hypothetical protein